MDSIEEVYSKDIYSPFLRYCQERNHRTMEDLRRCNFSELAKYADVSPTLLIRIKSLYETYCKKHPDLLMGRPAVRRKPPVRTANPELECRLRDYFQKHADGILRVVDVCKAVGAKRADVLPVLENAAWCKPVGTTTFFYSDK